MGAVDMGTQPHEAADMGMSPPEPPAASAVDVQESEDQSPVGRPGATQSHKPASFFFIGLVIFTVKTAWLSPALANGKRALLSSLLRFLYLLCLL